MQSNSRTTWAALSALAMAAATLAPSVMAQSSDAPAKPSRATAIPGELLLFEGQRLTGSLYRLDRARPSLSLEFNVGSIALHPGEKWELCDQPKFRGNCLTISEDTLEIGRASIKSARPVT